MITAMDRDTEQRLRTSQYQADSTRLKRAKQRTEQLSRELLLRFDKEELRLLMVERLVFTLASGDAILFEVWNLEAEQILRTGRIDKHKIPTTFYSTSCDSYKEIP